jgi:hypothetical protein
MIVSKRADLCGIGARRERQVLPGLRRSRTFSALGAVRRRSRVDNVADGFDPGAGLLQQASAQGARATHVGSFDCLRCQRRCARSYRRRFDARIQHIRSGKTNGFVLVRCSRSHQIRRLVSIKSMCHSDSRLCPTKSAPTAISINIWWCIITPCRWRSIVIRRRKIRSIGTSTRRHKTSRESTRSIESSFSKVITQNKVNRVDETSSSSSGFIFRQFRCSRRRFIIIGTNTIATIITITIIIY